MSEKLILPTEMKLCCTCSYWDGDRQVDEEMKLVVVEDETSGECLVKGKKRHALSDTRQEETCMWECVDDD